ncbi:SCO family protein [Chondromyces crocatus]|uniref:Thioredoxin domain-containing protein n=1 Tax=Chondromyces crocatus TaxID=52 RepID=A0A0K1E9V7_CHOCO|nr:SCO family protein [Chondromyces crocatus]AKT37624.1 uncharacterized protein CMC5_017660 [Chondromyces crocatus]
MRVHRSEALVVVAALCTASSGCREEPAPLAHAVPQADATEPFEAKVTVAPAVGVVVPDEELLDQDGQAVRLQELARDRVLVVNFVFTACTTICAPMTRIFAKLQGELGDALERDVRLVSISLDPAVDTPERLTRFAEPYERRKGWSFLTGSREKVYRVLDGLGGRVPMPAQHTPVTLIGSAGKGRWTRIDGIAPPERLAKEVHAYLPPVKEVRHLLPSVKAVRGFLPSREEGLVKETWWRSVPVEP